MVYARPCGLERGSRDFYYHITKSDEGKPILFWSYNRSVHARMFAALAVFIVCSSIILVYLRLKSLSSNHDFLIYFGGQLVNCGENS